MTNSPYKGTFKFDLTGQRFGLLTVVELSKRRATYDGRLLWKCKCDCGKIAYLPNNTLKTGHTSSCGCKRRRTNQRAVTHGQTRNGKLTNTYRSWSSMLERCRNKNAPNYKDYGGRGITVCKRWLKFENFLADMGARPVNKTIDRKNNDKGYSKTNCKWSTPKEQANNRRSSHVI